MLPVCVNFFAQEPEVNAAQLLLSPGPAPLQLASEAYAVLATALTAAADASDGSTYAMSLAWTGPAGTSICQAFYNLTAWLRGQAEKAAHTALVMQGLQVAAATAQAAMVHVVAELAAIQAAKIAAVASNSITGLAASALAASEVAHMAVRLEAATVMTMYAESAMSGLSALPPSSAPPAIASGAPVTPASLTGFENLPTGIGDLFGRSGPGIGTTGPGGALASGGGARVLDSPVSNPGGSPPVSGPPAGGQPGGGQPGAGQPGGGGGQPGPVDPQQLGSDMQAPPLPSGSGDADPTGAGPAVPEQSGLYGTPQTSTTLVGLNGGAASTAALGVTRGGGTVLQTATGPRMPVGWKPAATQAFGAGAGTPAEQPLPQRSPPRGASAPRAQLRRRRDEQRDGSKTFVAGGATDVPVLDHPPGLGVIEYDAGDTEPVSASERVLASGVLDSDAKSDFE
ncbi:PPE domain-containing protein [Nocardia tengchongensis]|uniref:PPE domain-containing protein n=1 Tax=Nocardia tengchongensis TaxID=2055889 RepID=UPI003623B2EB